MNKKIKKIRSLIEKFFVVAGFFILTVTLVGGWYFNRFDSLVKKKENLKKSHSMLAQLIVPSLSISDFSEVRHLLFMSSTPTETYLVVNDDNIIIMPDYADNVLAEYAIKAKGDCAHISAVHARIGKAGYLVSCSELKADISNSDQSDLGALVSFSQDQDFAFSPMVGAVIGALFLFYLLLIFLFRRALYRNVIRPLIFLKDQIRSVSVDKDVVSEPAYEIQDAPEELLQISDAFKRLLLKLREEYKWRIEVEKSNALIDLAAGVAHDIRSPLVALDVLIRDIKNIPEGQRVVIRHAANRIKDIANNLLAQYRQDKTEYNDISQAIIKPELISDLLTSLVSEKRIQYRNSPLKLELYLDEGTHGLFAMVSLANFNRSMSNLIDNCVEAESSTIMVVLKLKMGKSDNIVSIEVVDNGCGLAKPLQDKILQGELISTKKKGNGIGLSRTKKIVEAEWKGALKFFSVENSGTTVSLELPQATPPQWFLPMLQVSPYKTIVVVDDDESIHHVWKERFNDANPDAKFLDIYSPEDLMRKFDSIAYNESIFLVDYEFLSSDITGISIIETLKIAPNSYLVTSRHEDIFLRQEVERIGLKVIPKTYVAHIPIIINSSVQKSCVDLVLIDDDISLASSWVFRGLQCHKNVETFNTVNEFKINIDRISKNIPIYIDSELGGQVKGEHFAKELFESGFANIYLSTGHDPSSFPSMPWIKSIVSKEPPF